MFTFLTLVLNVIKSFIAEGLLFRKQTKDREQELSLTLEAERVESVKTLQLKEMEHPFMWWSKFLIMLSVALYIFARFMVKTFGLGDYQIAVQDLDNWEASVASLVLGYMFLKNEIKKVIGNG